jgi:hypothetical protein
LSHEQREDLRVGGLINPPVEPGTFLYQANMFNDYLIDRLEQKHFTFSGMTHFAVQDTAMQENQWGPISDRSREHLVSTDKIIIRVRQRLIEAAKNLTRGIEPAEPWNPDGYRYFKHVEPPKELAEIAAIANVQ